MRVELDQLRAKLAESQRRLREALEWARNQVRQNIAYRFPG
jgi:hypothetical protein